MDLQLGLSLPSNDSKGLFTSFPVNHDSSDVHKKRSFSQLSEHNRDGLLPTLPLLPLKPNSQQNDEDHHSSCSITTKNDGDDGETAVGWPPIIAQRKKLRYDGDGMVGIHNKYGSVDPIRGSNPLYVKVKMEGEGIGRKIDLSLHHSFQELKETLIGMFGKCQHHSNSYELAYQDKEGDWLLAEDLPWKNFLQCAQRLKLLKTSVAD